MEASLRQRTQIGKQDGRRSITARASVDHGTSMSKPATSAVTRFDDLAEITTRRAAMLAGATAALSAASVSSVHAAVAPPRPFCGVVSPLPSWVYSSDWQEGVVDYAGFSTWYRALGKPPSKKKKKARSFGPVQPTQLPVLFLHDGPGMPSRYLETLELLGEGTRRICFYDQIGCGNSRRASRGKGPGFSRITPDLFISEIDAVRQALELDQVHLVGHGWGGLLALAYLAQAAEPLTAQGIASISLLSTPPSWSSLIEDRVAQGKALGAELWDALQREDESAEFQAALAAYERAYVCTSQPVTPSCLQISQAAASPSIRKAMTGGKRFQLGGALADWALPIDAADKLAGLPVLLVQGAGTMVHIDAYERVLGVLTDHISQHDVKAATA